MLARELGYASPARMLGEMKPSELAEWLAEYSISPWGEGRADFRAALHTSITANVNRNSKVRAEPYDPRDFMYDHITEARDEKERSKRMAEQLRAQLLAFSAKSKRSKS